MAKGKDRPSLSGAGRELTARQEDEVWLWIMRAVGRTILDRPMPISEEMPESEIGHRVDLAAEIFRHLYFEARWSRQRIRDHLTKFLTLCIDGAKEHENAVICDAKGDAVVQSVMYGKEKLNEIERERRLSALAVTPDRDTVATGPTIIIKGDAPEE